MRKPVIYINSKKAQELDRDLTLQKLYYYPEGYYQTAGKMQDACKKAGYEFILIEIKNWLSSKLCIKFTNLDQNLFICFF